MSIFPDNPALYGAGGCGAHQQIMGWPQAGGPGPGDPPAWVPEGAVAHLDFTEDPPRMYAGEVITDMETIMGDGTIRAWPFDPAMLDAGVSLGHGPGPGDFAQGIFIGPMAAVFDNNFSVVVEYEDVLTIFYSSFDFATDLDISCNPTSDTVNHADINSGLYLHAAGGEGPMEGAHKLAFTVTAASTYAAWDGESLIDDEIVPGTTFDPTTPVPPDEVGFNVSRLKKLTVYQPIKTEAEQRTLTA